MKRKLTLHSEPTETSDVSPRDVAAIEFARRLQEAIAKRGWTQNDLARRASEHLPEGVTVHRDSISRYINLKNFPSARNLTAIAAALGMDKMDLIPTKGVSSDRLKQVVPVDARDMGGGRVWLRVNQETDWHTAIKILEMLKGGDEE